MNNKKNSFIDSIASNTPLQANSLAALESKSNVPNESNIDKEVSNNIKEPPTSVKKSASNKQILFIDELMDNHYLNHEKVKDKAPFHIEKSTHFKIKLLATVCKVSMIELSNAIVTKFLDEHKGEIESLLKKSNYI